MDPFLGEIRLFPYSYVPKGWAACDGSTLQINQNQALFALLGTVFGGDGKTTFALPPSGEYIRVPAQSGGLEVKLHRELKDPRVLSAGDIPERAGVAQRNRGIIEAHVIKHVERFRAELKVFALQDPEFSHQRHVKLKVRRAEHVECTHITQRA